MEKNNITKDMSKSLDAVRGLMALLVALHHVRNDFMPQSLQPSGVQSVITFIFRVMTGLGDGPVIVFFVLSGFWISKVVIDRFQKQNFDWRVYLIERVLRLHIVLLPILLIQFFLIVIFYRLGPGAIFENLKVLFGNILFLQSFVGEYGGNFQLWSLQYEFWYYVLFPACIITFFSKKLFARILCGAIAVSIFCIFPMKQGLYFSIWLVGSAVYWVNTKKEKLPWLRRLSFFSPTLIGACLVALALLNARFGAGSEHSIYHSEYLENLVSAIIAGFAFLFFSMENENENGKIHAMMASIINPLSSTASFSYSLYVIHVPVLLGLNVVALSFFDQYRIINAKSILVALGVWVFIVIISYVYSRLTEAHYKKMKNKWTLNIRNKMVVKP